MNEVARRKVLASQGAEGFTLKSQAVAVSTWRIPTKVTGRVRWTVDMKAMVNTAEQAPTDARNRRKILASRPRHPAQPLEAGIP